MASDPGHGQALRAAHASGHDATDDATLVEAAGGTVVLVPGDPRNLKLTTPADLLVARTLLTETGRTETRLTENGS